MEWPPSLFMKTESVFRKITVAFLMVSKYVKKLNHTTLTKKPQAIHHHPNTSPE